MRDRKIEHEVKYQQIYKAAEKYETNPDDAKVVLKERLSYGVDVNITREEVFKIPQGKRHKELKVDCPPIVKLAFERKHKAVEFLLKNGAHKSDALYGYALGVTDENWGAHYRISVKNMLDKGANKDAAIQAFSEIGSREDLFKVQYQKQLSQRKRRTALVVLLGIIFPPSLFVSIPLWIRAKNKELIQQVTVPENKFSEAVNRRRVFREGSPKVEDPTKPKKINLEEKEKWNGLKLEAKTYLMDKAQLRRFSLFAKHDQPYLIAHKDKIKTKIEDSKKKSREILAEIESVKYRR